MNRIEIWGDVDQYRHASKESPEHLWPKVEMGRRKQDQIHPWFEGDYRYEKKVADRVPDCCVLGGPVNRWIEFVMDSDQEYRAKTREALRLGFVVYWVFHDEFEEEHDNARQELLPELQQPFQFGEYNPIDGTLKLGDPITYKNYEFPVEAMDEFSPQTILGYRSGAAQIKMHGGGYDLGMFEVSGNQRRLIVHPYFDIGHPRKNPSPKCKCFRAVAPDQSVADTPWGYPTPDGLETLVEEGQIMRLGPVRYQKPQR